jgi:hypothetical protein
MTTGQRSENKKAKDSKAFTELSFIKKMIEKLKGKKNKS